MNMNTNKGTPMLNKLLTSTGMSIILETNANEDALRKILLDQWNIWVREKNEEIKRDWGMKLVRAMVEDGLVILPKESLSRLSRTGASLPTEEVLLACKLLAPKLLPTIVVFLKYIQKVIFLHLPKLTSAGQIKLRKPALKRLANRVNRVKVQV